MIRFSWLQFRAQAAVAGGILVVIAVAFALTGPSLVHLYDTTVATCSAHGNCSAATVAFLSRDRLLQDFGNLVIALPAIVGIFWGAPLIARELETGTYRLVWTQGVTRARWLAARLGTGSDSGCATRASTSLTPPTSTRSGLLRMPRRPPSSISCEVGSFPRRAAAVASRS